MKKLKVCIIGLGRAGRFHLASLQQMQHVELAFVIDPHITAEDQFIRDNNLRLTNLDSALSDDDLDAVIVSCPTQYHYDYISQFLKAGKHVFTEKPLGKTVNEINACYDLAEEQSLTLHLGFQRRFDHNFQALKESINQIGKPRIIKTSSRDNPKPSIEYLSISGNIFHDMLIHDFDMLCFLLGPKIPMTVYAIGHAYDSEIEAMNDYDTVLVTIHYEDGLLCTIDTSRTAPYGYDQRIELFGENGMAIVENEKENSLEIFTRTGHRQAVNKYSFPQRYRDCYLRELDHFIKSISYATKTSVSRAECVLSHLIANAAYDSAKQGRPIAFKDEYANQLSKL